MNFLVGQILKLQGLPEEAVKTEVSNVILKEELKQIMLKIDPYRLNVIVC